MDLLELLDAATHLDIKGKAPAVLSGIIRALVQMDEHIIEGDWYEFFREPMVDGEHWPEVLRQYYLANNGVHFPLPKYHRVRGLPKGAEKNEKLRLWIQMQEIRNTIAFTAEELAQAGIDSATLTPDCKEEHGALKRNVRPRSVSQNRDYGTLRHDTVTD